MWWERSKRTTTDKEDIVNREMLMTTRRLSATRHYKSNNKIQFYSIFGTKKEQVDDATSLKKKK